MTETEQLISRIYRLAEATGKSPATISGVVLGSGARIAELKAGKTITLAKYEFAQAKLAELENAARCAA